MEWEFAVVFSRSGSSFTVSGSNWNLEVLIFVEGGKPDNPEKKTLGARTRTNNKLNVHMTPGPGFEPRTYKQLDISVWFLWRLQNKRRKA